MSVEHFRGHRRKSQKEIIDAHHQLAHLADALRVTGNITADLLETGITKYRVNDRVVGILKRTAQGLHDKIWASALQDGNLDQVQINLPAGSLAREVSDFIFQKLAKKNGEILLVPNELLDPAHISQTFYEAYIPGLYVEVTIPQKTSKGRVFPTHRLVGRNHLPQPG